MSATPAIRRQGKAEVLDAVFSAVADATRRSMLDRLRDGELTVSQLAEPYAMSLNAVSKHIKTLERAGLVRREIRGREHFCRLHAERFTDAMQWMTYYTEFWNDRMAALEEHLIEKRKRGSE
jgi:DNA-binding transcriptional ArsR family regulator